MMKQNDNSLLDIFKTEADKNGSDLLAMSDFFNILISKTYTRINSQSENQLLEKIQFKTGNLASAIKYGIDVSNIGTLVADSSHFGTDIVDGLKSGKYRIGTSNKIAGNYTPTIVDKNGRIVKQFTLKRALNPAELLEDFQMISIQSSLNQISSELQMINSKIDYIINFSRTINLSVHFFNARSFIRNAYNNPDKQEDYLIKADDELTYGLNALYSDLENMTEELSQLKIYNKNTKCIDGILAKINEDLLMIPKYVGLKLYLYYYQGKNADFKDVLEEYSYKINQLNRKPNKKSRYTIAELIHEYYPYGKDNRDFWLDVSEKITESINTYSDITLQNDNEFIYIDDYKEDFEDE